MEPKKGQISVLELVDSGDAANPTEKMFDELSSGLNTAEEAKLWILQNGKPDATYVIARMGQKVRMTIKEEKKLTKVKEEKND